MKIAVISNIKFPIAEPFVGGMEMLTHALVKGLTQRGHTVDLFAHPDSDADFNLPSVDYAGDLPDDFLEMSSHNPVFDDQMIAMHHAYSDIMLQLKKADYDVVHNNSQHYVPLSLVAELPSPVATTLHVPPFPFFQSAAITARSVANHHFTGVSGSLLKRWEKFIGKGTVIYNGTDIDKWTFAPQAKKNTAFWSGRICREKAPHLALAAAAEAGMFLHLAGPKSDEKYFDEYIAPLLDDRKNKYVGHLTQQEMLTYMQNAEVFIFSSVWEEPYGLVLAEALACGTPVAAFRSGAAPEILDATCGSIAEKGSVTDLTRAVLACKKLDRADCRRRAEAFCSIENMVTAYENFFRKIGQKTSPLQPV